MQNVISATPLLQKQYAPPTISDHFYRMSWAEAGRRAPRSPHLFIYSEIYLFIYSEIMAHPVPGAKWSLSSRSFQSGGEKDKSTEARHVKEKSKC